MKINNKRELQNITINHSANIDYKDFMKIYRECTKEPYSFLTIDTTLPASDLLIKLIVADQIKILDRKIKQNKVQYDLDRLAAKISAYSSNNLDKYEYLIGQDLGYRPSVVEKARFGYSLLSKFLNKGLKEENKRERPLKILKSIEDNTEEQLKAIKSDTK